MPETRTDQAVFIADCILDMAADLDRHGLWTGSPNFLDPATDRLDVIAAAYKATTGSLPFLFGIPTEDASAAARKYVEDNPTTTVVLETIAAHMATVRPDADWTDDPIDRLAAWPRLLGVTADEIPQTLRDIAHAITRDVTAPAAA